MLAALVANLDMEGFFFAYSNTLLSRSTSILEHGL